jgi:para-nitrobenzyl esterase
MRLLELQAAHTPQTYAYLFAWKSPAFGGVFGAAHALDLPFVFGTLDDPGLGRMIGGDPAAAILSERMQDAWLAFARSGSPATEQLPAWEPYAPPGRATMVFDEEVSLENAPLEAERAVWDALW